MADNNRNLIAAIVLCAVVLFGWYAIMGPRLNRQHQAQQQTAQQQAAQQQTQAEGGADTAQTPKAETGAPETGAPTPHAGNAPPARSEKSVAPRDEVLKRSARIAIDTPSLGGSIALTGGRIDDLSLRKFHETVDNSSPIIQLLTPPGTAAAYYVNFGWVPAGSNVPVPDENTVWEAEQPGPLTVDHPVVLRWDNGQGLRFERVFAVDENYMFTVTQRVVNTGGEAASLRPFGLISRRGTPPGKHYYLLHEGFVGVFDGKLEELEYKDVQKKHDIRYTTTGGWLGITDKYWLVSLIPDQAQPITGRFLDTKSGGEDRYQVDYLRDAVTVPAGGQMEISDRLFAGAKVVDIVDQYRAKGNIVLFDRAIDWGWFYFLTKPVFQLLDTFFHMTGNFGVAILMLTVLIKMIFFPLANRSYAAMSRMKALQPEMKRIRDAYKEDKVRQQQELMNLYKTQKVNPVAGCLPMLIQIPVFFALYKVLYVTIEMRHQPFFGWIHDLAAPDPTNLFTLFGLVPWSPPAVLHVGIWAILMGISMFLQQKLNPAPQDPMQQRLFMLMPIFFTFLLASFPAGLVIYWTWNNTLSIGQQWLIMRKHGTAPTPAST
jgi:YidC/Oxa1 family membrane protein insertase